MFEQAEDDRHRATASRRTRDQELALRGEVSVSDEASRAVGADAAGAAAAQTALEPWCAPAGGGLFRLLCADTLPRDARRSPELSGAATPPAAGRHASNVHPSQ